MDSKFMMQKSSGEVLTCRGQRNESMYSRTSAWVGLISSTILVVLFYLIINTSQNSSSQEAFPNVAKIRMLLPDSKLHFSEYLIFSSSCTVSVFQPVHVSTAGGIPACTGVHRAPPLRPSCVDYNSCTHNLDLMKLIAASLQCEKIAGIWDRRGKTPLDSLTVSCSRYNIKIRSLSKKICSLKPQSATRLQVQRLRRLSHERSSHVHCTFRTTDSELLCDGDARKLYTVLHVLSGDRDRQLRPAERLSKSTARRYFTPGFDVAWFTLAGPLTRQVECFPRYLSGKLGDHRLRRILAAGSSSGLHGKWRAIVIADTVIGVLGFLIAVTALSCCIRKRGASMRCWWNFSCHIGGRSRSGDLSRDLQDLPAFESSPETSRPLPPMSSPALYDLRLSLPDFRAHSRRESGESRSRRTQAGSGPLLHGAEAFSFETLAAATGGFAEENKIGSGSFGVVYRGVLFDGRVVAIKRADRSNARKIEENESAFEAELEVLSRLHHKYLVNLVGFCDDQDERLLVYEYMSNGTLHDHLHRHRSIAFSSWQARIKVALQAARGIEYLHTYASRQIIHRDIKSANILLDSKWNARVSDFGLSLISPSEGLSHLTTGAAGTLGYMDPEYYGLQHLTPKSDVYSFGVVLMELLTGKKAIHRRNTLGTNVSPSNVNVVDYAVPPIRADELLSILDSRLRAPEESENAAVEIMAEVAEQCVRPEGKHRPTMAEIVGRLETAYALSRASETSILREYEGSTSSQTGPSRQLDSANLPLDREKGDSLELGVSATIPESHEQDSGTQSVPDESQESESDGRPKDTET